jgi:RNA polymerase sigma-70 factor, ECF subfamily
MTRRTSLPPIGGGGRSDVWGPFLTLRGLDSRASNGSYCAVGGVLKDRSEREQLYRKFSHPLARYVGFLLPGSPAVPDLVHDVFVKAFESAATFQGEPAALGAWLFVIARNTVADHRRRDGRTRAESPAVLECRRDAALLEEPLDWGDWGALHALLDGLTPVQRQVIVLHYRVDLEVAEVAEMLGRTPDAVRHLEHRALASLREGLAAAA